MQLKADLRPTARRQQAAALAQTGTARPRSPTSGSRRDSWVIPGDHGRTLTPQSPATARPLICATATLAAAALAARRQLRWPCAAPRNSRPLSTETAP